MAEDLRKINQFDAFNLDVARGVLLAEDGSKLALRPKSFALLLHFARNAGRLVNRDEIMHTVWPDVFVTDDSIAQCIVEIRRVLGGDRQRLLRTVQRRGYRFDAVVSAQDATPSTQSPEVSLPSEQAPS